MTYRDVVAALRIEACHRIFTQHASDPTRTCDTTSLPQSQVTRGHALND